MDHHHPGFGSEAVEDDFNDDDNIERLLEQRKAELDRLKSHNSEVTPNTSTGSAAIPSPESHQKRLQNNTQLLECNGGVGFQKSSDGASENTSALQLNEMVDELLERTDHSHADHRRRQPRSKKLKRVLANRVVEHFDLLPNGWVEVTHSSGLPVYLHKSTRVATFSRPYFLGPASIRNHDVPEMAIPCYHARRIRKSAEQPTTSSTSTGSQSALGVSGDIGEAKESSEATAYSGNTSDQGLQQNPSFLPAPEIKLQSTANRVNSLLNSEDIFHYAKGLFEFKDICVLQFNKWSEARNFKKEEAKKQLEFATTSRPTLSKNVRLLTIPSVEKAMKPDQRGLYLSLHDGKSAVSVLHEYSQKVLKRAVEYTTSENRNSSLPYHAVARVAITSKGMDSIENLSMREKIQLLLKRGSAKQAGEEQSEEIVVLGEGDGNSKRAAKMMAAKAAISSLLPDVEFDDEGLLKSNGGNESSQIKADTFSGSTQEVANQGDSYTLFDECGITDTRIPDLCTKTGEPSPFIILQEIIKRNVAFCDTELEALNSRRIRHQKHLFGLTFGEHCVRVVASNKREGKQRAAQELIQKLLPEMKNWGSILRVYGQASRTKQREARKNQESVIKLQDEIRKQNEQGEETSFEPNKAILDKLRSEMLKLAKNIGNSSTPALPALLSGGENGSLKRRFSDGQQTPPGTEDGIRPAKLSATCPPIAP